MFIGFWLYVLWALGGYFAIGVGIIVLGVCCLYCFVYIMVFVYAFYLFYDTLRLLDVLRFGLIEFSYDLFFFDLIFDFGL